MKSVARVIFLIFLFCGGSVAETAEPKKIDLSFKAFSKPDTSGGFATSGTSFPGTNIRGRQTFVNYLMNPLSNPDIRLSVYSHSGRLTDVNTYRLNRRAGRVSFDFDFLLEQQDPLSFFGQFDASRLFISAGLGFDLTERWSLRGDLFTVRPTYVFFSKSGTPAEVVLSTGYRLGHTGFKLIVGEGYRVNRSPDISRFHEIFIISYSVAFRRPKPDAQPITAEGLPPPAETEQVVYFRTGSNSFLPQESETVARLAQHLRVFSSARVFLVNGSGETSAMAQRRIESLRDALEKEGIARDRIVWLDWPDLRSNDPQADYRPAPNLFVKIEDVRPYSK